MNRRLSNDVDSVLPSNVERRQNSVSTFFTKHFYQSATRRFCNSGIDVLFFLDLILAADACNLEQKFSDKRDGGLLQYQV
jgi:hypothetical protein